MRLWSSNVPSTGQGNVIARLLDSGNLEVINSNMGETDPIWESFWDVTDSYLPKMEVSSNARTNERITFTSWKSPSDPAPGNFSMYLDPLNIPQVYLMKGTRPYWRSGPWNSRIFIGIPIMESFYNGFSLQDDKEGTFSLVYTYDRPLITYYFLDPNGTLSQVYWDEEGKNRGVTWSSYETECDVYGKCGAFGICNPLKNPICSCARGFKPRNLEEWDRGNWTSGCIRKTELNCEIPIINGTRKSGKDGFLNLETMKVPDFASLWVGVDIFESHSPIKDQCSSYCLGNCSCVGYAYDVGIGCMIWSGDLIDLQKFPSGGASLYIRVPEQELDKSRDFKAITAISLSLGAILIALFSLFLWSRRVRKQRVTKKVQKKLFSGRNKFQRISSKTRFQDNLKLQELKLLSLDELSTATDSFSSANKLGQGGFGPVYMGKLLDGQEIAVKRLSRASGQGLEEFMNEMVVISKVQHRNLVRLLGCCAEEDEKILVYEFMPNKSLDTFLFDPEKRKELDWTKRFSIIDGICRGLLYLHRDSRLRIIHRDMKASNILLDEELTPKISDFGMARIFGVKEDEGNTERVVGTYGYMALEYAMEGLFSEKSDVFSFGVLLLEIVSGRRNTSFYHDEESWSLLGLAWRLWNEDNAMSLLDAAIPDNSNPTEVLRCIHLGLLCTQELPRYRPTISTVILMLNSEITDLPRPNQPAFIDRQMARYSPSFMHGEGMDSSNNITITTVGGR